MTDKELEQITDEEMYNYLINQVEKFNDKDITLNEMCEYSFKNKIGLDALIKVVDSSGAAENIKEKIRCAYRWKYMQMMESAS